MRPVASASFFILYGLFQSSPGVVAGCDPLSSLHALAHAGFNPHPAWWPGATGVSLAHRLALYVSILTRRGGRVRPSAMAASPTSRLFQSSPGVVAGCDTHRPTNQDQTKEFQSSPGVVAGCDPDGGGQREDHRDVSILTRRGGRVRRIPWDILRAEQVEFQSSPGVVAGCD